MKLLIFGFLNKGNISGMVVKKLNIKDKFLIPYYKKPHINGINDLINLITINNPEYILGIGSYSGIDFDSIRIETLTKNKFRNNRIGEKDKYVISPFLSIDNNYKLANAMGNSWCNLVSYKIMELIDNHKISSSYTFLHIPKKYNLNNTVSLLRDKIKELN